jgi:lysozyme family protein
MSAFDDSFAELLGEEGGLSLDPKDPGNWTGGKVGVGTLVGSKYGISAASYPTLDIPNLTLQQAKDIAKRDYWDAVRGDDLPPSVGHALFDCAYNQGVGTAVKLFQKALGVTPDGVFGPGTMAAFRAVPLKTFARAFTIARIVRYSMGPGWMSDAKGWTGRALDSFAEMLA